MTDLINRADALAAVKLGDTVTALQRKIEAIPAVTLPSLNAGAVKLKPLVWKKRANETHVSNAYRIGRSYGQGPEPFMVSHGSNIIGWSDSEDGCRQIADQHNRVLTLAAIETTPDPRDAVIARLVGLMPEVIEALRSDGLNVSLVLDVAAAIAAAKETLT